jgi:hypothetical protein
MSILILMAVCVARLFLVCSLIWGPVVGLLAAWVACLPQRCYTNPSHHNQGCPRPHDPLARACLAWFVLARLARTAFACAAAVALPRPLLPASAAAPLIDSPRPFLAQATTSTLTQVAAHQAAVDDGPGSRPLMLNTRVLLGDFARPFACPWLCLVMPFATRATCTQLTPSLRMWQPEAAKAELQQVRQFRRLRQLRHQDDGQSREVRPGMLAWCLVLCSAATCLWHATLLHACAWQPCIGACMQRVPPTRLRSKAWQQWQSRRSRFLEAPIRSLLHCCRGVIACTWLLLVVSHRCNQRKQSGVTLIRLGSAVRQRICSCSDAPECCMQGTI